MAKYLIDAHLPYYFSLWSGKEYVHVFDLNEKWTDTEIWDYAKDNKLTIVTKDTDFSDRILLSQPPPRVIHIKFGNMKMREFHQTISSVWNEACKLSKQYRLVRIFKDRIECIN
jgi:predicted nuclease of predicted toxin-antitoxin system